METTNKTMKKTLCLSVRLESLVSISEIAKNLGMEAEEIIRLKQQLGIAHVSKMWSILIVGK